MQESTPIREQAARKGIVVTHALPNLPSGAAPVPGSQYVLVHADSAVASAVSLVVPIPLVTDMAVSAMHRQDAGRYKARYASVDPYAIAVDRIKGSPLLGKGADALKMMPFVYIVEGSDGAFRLTLVFRVEGDGWTGRYLYHLPTPFIASEIQDPQPPKLETLRHELIVGADTLRSLMERDARGELRTSGTKVDVGSYYLVGGNVAGLVSAGALHYPNNDLVEEGNDYAIVRARGDMNAKAGAGYLVFGVHYFRKDQLHTFRKKD